MFQIPVGVKPLWSYTQTESLQFTDKPSDAANQDGFSSFQIVKNNFFFIRNNFLCTFSSTFVCLF